MAERQALHLLAVPCTRQPNLWRQGVVLAHTEIIQSGSRTVAVGSHNRRAERHGGRRILSPASLTRGQVKGGDGDRPQDCGFVLHYGTA
jgi:hypothetical protein